MKNDAEVVIFIICGLLIVVGITILSILVFLRLLRWLYKYVTKPDRKECGYCINSYILCCHDDNHEALHPARYCPICGRKL